MAGLAAFEPIRPPLATARANHSTTSAALNTFAFPVSAGWGDDSLGSQGSFQPGGGHEHPASDIHNNGLGAGGGGAFLRPSHGRSSPLEGSISVSQDPNRHAGLGLVGPTPPSFAGREPYSPKSRRRTSLLDRTKSKEHRQQKSRSQFGQGDPAAIAPSPNVTPENQQLPARLGLDAEGGGFTGGERSISVASERKMNFITNVSARRPSGTTPGIGSTGVGVATYSNSKPVFQTYSVKELPEAPPPLNRINHSLTYHDGSVYLFGGRSGSVAQTNYIGGLFVFLPARSAWMEVPAKGQPPMKRGDHSASVVGSKLYIYGGRKHHIVFSDWSTFDFDSGQWATVEYEGGSGPGALWGHTSCAVGQHIYVVGGVHSTEHTHLIHLFDTKYNYWRPVEGPVDVDPNGLYKCSVLHQGQSLYFLGLRAASGHLATQEVAQLLSNHSGMPGPHSSPKGVAASSPGLTSAFSVSSTSINPVGTQALGYGSVSGIPPPPTALPSDLTVRKFDLETMSWKEEKTSMLREPFPLTGRMLSSLLRLQLCNGVYLAKKDHWVFPVVQAVDEHGSILNSAVQGAIMGNSSSHSSPHGSPTTKTTGSGSKSRKKRFAEQTSNSPGTGAPATPSTAAVEEKMFFLSLNMNSMEWSLAPTLGTGGGGGTSAGASSVGPGTGNSTFPAAKAFAQRSIQISPFETKYGCCVYPSGGFVVAGGLNKDDHVLAKVIPTVFNSAARAGVAGAGAAKKEGAGGLLKGDATGGSSQRPTSSQSQLGRLSSTGAQPLPPKPPAGATARQGRATGKGSTANAPADPDVETNSSGRSSIVSQRRPDSAQALLLKPPSAAAPALPKPRASIVGLDVDGFLPNPTGRRASVAASDASRASIAGPASPEATSKRVSICVPMGSKGGPLQSEGGLPVAVLHRDQVAEWERRCYKDECQWIVAELARTEKHFAKEQGAARRARRLELREKQQSQANAFLARKAQPRKPGKGSAEDGNGGAAENQQLSPAALKLQQEQARLDALSNLRMSTMLFDCAQLSYDASHLDEKALGAFLCRLRWELVRRYVMSGKAAADGQTTMKERERRARQSSTLAGGKLGARGGVGAHLTTDPLASQKPPEVGTAGALVLAPTMSVSLDHPLVTGPRGKIQDPRRAFNHSGGAQGNGSGHRLLGGASASGSPEAGHLFPLSDFDSGGQQSGRNDRGADLWSRLVARVVPKLRRRDYVTLSAVPYTLNPIIPLSVAISREGDAH